MSGKMRQSELFSMPEIGKLQVVSSLCQPNTCKKASDLLWKLR